MTTLLLTARAAGGEINMLILVVTMLAIIWLFTIHPQQKKQKEIRNFQNALQEGSKIIINGGTHGTVKHIGFTTDRVNVEIACGVTVQVDRNFLYADTTSQNTTNAQP